MTDYHALAEAQLGHVVGRGCRSPRGPQPLGDRSCGIARLPDEIMCMIFSHLNGFEKLRIVNRVCKWWHSIVYEGSLFRSLDASEDTWTRYRITSHETIDEICRRFKQLRRLNLPEMRIGSKGVLALAQCTRLRTLRLGGSLVMKTNPGADRHSLRHLFTHCTRLRELDISRASMSAREMATGLAAVGQCVGLRSFCMYGAEGHNLSDPLRTMLSQCTALQTLNLAGLSALDSGILDVISALTSLTELYLDETSFILPCTPRGLRALPKENVFRKMRGLETRVAEEPSASSTSGTPVSTSWARLLHSCTRLQKLGLRRAKMDPEAWACVAQLPLLEILDVGETTVPGEAMLAIPCNCRRLRRLSLNSCSFNGRIELPALVEQIAGLPQLEFLEMADVLLPNASVVESLLGACASLRRLTFSAQLRGGDLPRLRSAFPRVRIFHTGPNTGPSGE
eukprot:gnl/Spiro4/3347_TR1634_c0_g1_i1.p1 gnl/Spiro4/3347_TR1634_c0_g1~~gnl/Spiro4/3347_TR1634_c0_g1_i1.p1  ORF type:complete len:453 (-),score=93.93 gnl/Spiro4/3347_TR1634_c0_g1_i1:50-1408(-)